MRPVRCLLAALTAALAACGLDVTGALDTNGGGDGGATPLDATADGATAADGGTPPPDGGGDGGGDGAPFDAGSRFDAGDDAADAACGPLVIVSDDFSNGIDTNKWITSGSASLTGLGGGAFVTLTPATGSQQGYLVFKTAQPLATFRVDFQVSLTTRGQSPVADGLAFAWFDRASVGASVGGKGLGLPKTTGGYAFALDTYQNSEIGDPGAPYFGVFKLDPTNDPGTVNWHMSGGNSIQLPFLVESTWHPNHVVVTNGAFDAHVDGLPVFAPLATSVIANGTFGFSAGTGGGSPLGVAIDNVVFAIPNPACPSVFP